MFSKSASLSDLFYAWKDYAREADRLQTLIAEHKRSPGTSLLDEACGSGGHIAFLRRRYTVEGLDLDPSVLEIARQKHPDIRFHRGGMVEFDLARRYDVVVCFFSSIGYVKTLPRLRQATRTMAPHALLVNLPEIEAARLNVSAAEGGAVRAAGLEVMLDHEGLMGRGLLTGRQPGP